MFTWCCPTWGMELIFCWLSCQHLKTSSFVILRCWIPKAFPLRESPIWLSPLLSWGSAVHSEHHNGNILGFQFPTNNLLFIFFLSMISCSKAKRDMLMVEETEGGYSIIDYLVGLVWPCFPQWNHRLPQFHSGNLGNRNTSHEEVVIY